MLEAMAHFNLDAFTHFFQVDEVMGPYSRPRVSQSYVLECGDGKWIALHMSSPEKFWQGLARTIELPDLFADPRFADPRARIENQEALIALLGERFKRRPRAEWCERLNAEDVPNSPMYDTSEALEDPQAKHLELTASATHPEMGLFRTGPLAGVVRRRPRARGAAAADARRARRRDPPRAGGPEEPPDRSPGMTPTFLAGPIRRAALLATLLAALGGAAVAQDGTVKMIVPFGPGTTTDTVGRVVAEGLGKALKQTVIRRQPGRRGRRDRHRCGRQGARRRQDDRHGHGRHARDQRLPLQEAAVRPDARLRAGRLRRLHADAARRRRGLAGEVAQGPGGAREPGPRA
jgi:hypothetical protein